MKEKKTYIAKEYLSGCKSDTQKELVLEEYKEFIGRTYKDQIILKRFEMPEENENGLLAPESGLITDSEGVDREDSYKPRYQNKGVVLAVGPECVCSVGEVIHWSLDNYPRSTIYFDKTDSSAWSKNPKNYSPYMLTYESYGVDYVEPAQ